MQSYRQARTETEHDQRLMLRSSALALLPGGQAQHEETVAALRTVTQRVPFDHAVMLDVYALLQQYCIKHLEIGPVQRLTEMLAQTAQRCLA